jgi:hypothetical protein
MTNAQIERAKQLIAQVERYEQTYSERTLIKELSTLLGIAVISVLQEYMDNKLDGGSF